MMSVCGNCLEFGIWDLGFIEFVGVVGLRKLQVRELLVEEECLEEGQCLYTAAPRYKV